MTIAAGEYRSTVGLKDLYIAEVLQDDSTAYLADTPEYFAPVVDAKQDAAVNRQTQYADDQPFDAMSSEGETTITLNVTNVPIITLAKITGRVFDPTTGRMYDNAGVPPYFAIMFRSQKSNGSFRYFCYLKGRFDMPSQEAASKTDSPDPKTTEITFTAIKTTFQFDLGDIDDGVKRVVGDDDVTNFSGTDWFTQVQTPGVSAISALALSSSTPAANASGVSKTANLSLVFNNALSDEAINNVTLLDATPAVVSGTCTLSSDKKTMTIAHTAFAGTIAHTIVIAVVDIYGQTLNTIVKFTTAA